MPKLRTPSAEPKTAGDLRGGNGARTQLYSFVQRFERLDEERGAIVDDMKEVMDEAKASGFDTKIMRQAIRRRKMDTADRVEGDSLLETYEDALAEAEKDELNRSIQDGE